LNWQGRKPLSEVNFERGFFRRKEEGFENLIFTYADKEYIILL